MFNAIEIKNRIKGIEETRKITRAMQLISAAKLKRAMNLLENNRKHFVMLRTVMKDILDFGGKISHSYFTLREGKRVAFLVIASDKGLAGEYNKRVLNMAYDEIIKHNERYIFTVGHVASNYFKKKGIFTDIEFLHIAQNPILDDARELTYDILDLYDKNALDEVYMAYTSMDTARRVNTEILRLLPLKREDFADVKSRADLNVRLDFAPSPQDVLDITVPQYLIGLIYGALVQSSAAEHYERMVSMKKALDNADEMLLNLRFSAQKARQERITTQLIEVNRNQVYD